MQNNTPPETQPIQMFNALQHFNPLLGVSEPDVEYQLLQRRALLQITGAQEKALTNLREIRSAQVLKQEPTLGKEMLQLLDVLVTAFDEQRKGYLQMVRYIEKKNNLQSKQTKERSKSNNNSKSKGRNRHGNSKPKEYPYKKTTHSYKADS